PSDASVTERIDVNRLADHDQISSAYGRGNTMFVTARDSWLKLPANEQKESLQHLLDYKGPVKYDNIVLRDAAGHLLGNISVYGVYVPAETKPETGNKAN
ncbi:MAG: hypothetical protein ACRD43_02940, partial [Pyrinomonadaceae bacterium]